VTSLRLKLTSTLLAAMSGIGLLALAAVYRNALQEVDEMYDFELRAVAQSIEPGGAIGPVPDDEVLVQIWSRDGALIQRSDPRLAAPRPTAPGYATLAGRDGAFRSYSRASAAGMVQAAQTLATRRELAFESSLRLLAPLLLALPVLGLAVWWLVRRSLQPVRRLGEALSARTDDALDPIPADQLPDELLPLVGGFNRLLQRLGIAFAAQRALLADAAHELRTPLAVLRLQLQTLQRSAGPQEQQAAIEALRGGIDRATRLVQQLLILARQEPGATAGAAATLRFDQLVRETLAELVPLADDKSIDLSLQAGQPISLRGDSAGLHALVGNLVDNALRYTPAGGVVEVSLGLAAGRAVLAVRDSGPGIPEAQRALVLQRFYRAPGSPSGGSGLGLAIATAVVQRHGGSLSLGQSEGGGLRVEVSLPQAS
jgi:two-component system OmpR family sensor kinase